MAFKIKRFAKYDSNDKEFDPKVKLITGSIRLSDRDAPTYEWEIQNHSYETENLFGETSKYRNDFNSSLDKDRIKKLRRELKNGSIFHSPPGDPLESKTHCLGEHSKPKAILKKNREIVCSKNVNGSDRFVYSVKYPYYDEEKEKYIFPIVLNSCKGHNRLGVGNYSDFR